MRYLKYLLAGLLIVGTVGAIQAVEWGLETYQGTVRYDFEVKKYEKGKEKEPSSAVKTSIWRKGELEYKELESSSRPGIKVPTFTLKDGVYTYFTEQKIAIKKPLPKVEPAPKEKVQVKPPEGKKVSEEKYDDKLCEVYELEFSGRDKKTGEITKNNMKSWFWKEKKIVLKIIITTEGKDEKGKPVTNIMEMAYKNVDFKDIPDTVFALPEGTKITETPSATPGMTPVPPAKAPEEKVAEPEKKEEKKPEVVKEPAKPKPMPSSIKYRVHAADIGWMDWVKDGQISGTTGQSRRLEAIQIELVDCPERSVQYRVHVQDIGWMDWVRDGQIAGTTGQSRRMEAIQIKLLKSEPKVEKPVVKEEPEEKVAEPEKKPKKETLKEKLKKKAQEELKKKAREELKKKGLFP